MRLITNRNNLGRPDNMEHYLLDACKNTKVKIAVAFFTDYKLIEKLLDNGCSIDMIVRLNDGTSPDALRRIYKKDKVQVSYFTSTYFHPKLYLIPNVCAFVGSSNLTKNAMKLNNEINLKVDVEEDSELFDELNQLFMEYWYQAMPLSEEKLNIFEECMQGREPGYSDFKNRLGDLSFENVIGGKKKTKEEEFTLEIKTQYTAFIEAFRNLESMYNSTDERYWKDIPLRIEIDKFLWWIGETQYSNEEWDIKEKYSEEKTKAIVKELKTKFLSIHSKELNNTINSYNMLKENFGAEEKIEKLSEDELFDTLSNNIFSFRDSSRWTSGGLASLKKTFFKENNIEKVKNTIKYLIYGEDQYIKRIFNCMNEDEYKLNHFGSSTVKELFGYMNKEHIPVYNGRVMKSMSYLGLGRY